MPTTKQIKLINKKKFTKVILDQNFETFVVHIVVLKTLLSKLLIQSDRKGQITSLFIKKITILNKNSDFANIFSKKKALILPDQTNLSKYAIKLKSDK